MLIGNTTHRQGGFKNIVPNVSVLAEVGDLKHESVKPPQSTLEAETLMIPLMPPFWQTHVISSLSFSQIIKL